MVEKTAVGPQYVLASASRAGDGEIAQRRANAPLHAKQCPQLEPLYDTDPRTGATVEVFYADRVLTGMRGAGWHWWSCKPGALPEWPPNGPFATSYGAYRDALGRPR